MSARLESLLSLLASAWIFTASPSLLGSETPAAKASGEAEPAATVQQWMDAMRLLQKEKWQPAVNEERSRDAEDVYGKVAPAIVVIRSASGHGTGWFVEEGGWIITNHHVVANCFYDVASGTMRVKVYMGTMGDDGMMALPSDDEGIPAVIYKVDRDKDLAILKLVIDDAVRLPRPIPLASSPPRPGSACLAIGHPSSGLLWSVRRGIVSGTGEFPKDYIGQVIERLFAGSDEERENLQRQLSQTVPYKVVVSDCGVNPGDSGGPLLNEKGEVIAVTEAIPSNIVDDKIAYHIHLDELRAFLKERPDEPVVYPTSPFPPANGGGWEDLTGDRVPDTVVFRVADGDTTRVTGIMVDLDGDTSPEVWQRIQAGDASAVSELDVEFTYQWEFFNQSFYDTDGDGQLDAVLVPAEGGGFAILRLRGDHWIIDGGREDVVDVSLMEDMTQQRLLNAVIHRALGLKQRLESQP